MDRDLGFQMLEQVRRDIEENHFDPTLKGVNLQERFTAARAEIEAAEDNGDVFRAIASAVRSLKDSQTQFIPPARAAVYNYGWTTIPCGRECVISEVDASGPANGILARGDRLLAINGTAIDRGSWRAWAYYLAVIEPHAKLRLTVAAPEQPAREVEIVTQVTPGARDVDVFDRFHQFSNAAAKERRENRSRFRVYDSVLVWRTKAFPQDEEDLKAGLQHARDHPSLILDLRGNSGGTFSAMESLIGGLFDRDVAIGTLKRRADRKALIAKTAGANAWAGRLLVLVDGETAGTAEIFAAVVQRENRGLLLGDRTAGIVQEGRCFSHGVGRDRVTLFGVMVATAEIELSDGRLLEGNGVTPDFLVTPKPTDIAARKDPVLLMALKQFGVTPSAAELGQDT